MKSFPFKSTQARNRRGIALLVVLISLVLLTVLVVAFLSNGLTEVKSAKIYSSGANVKLLAQTAANIVLSEIKDGTSGLDADGKVLAWASQPGMIRSYDTSGNLYRYYKLYSSSQLIGPASGGNVGTDIAADLTNMANWNQNPAYYTDLNSPVKVTDSNGASFNHYPILPGDLNINGVTTPMSAYTATTTSKTGAVSAVSALTYGGANPNPDIQGFWVLAPGTPGALSVAATASNYLPMPVQWLYVLQDGTVCAPSTAPPASGGTTVIIAQATPTNPIVGRIAFWTDDESSKVNINTASEGVYVDTPRVSTAADVKLANFQPAQNEFQRYPGHPAMTSLSTVLGSWLTLPASTSTPSTQNAYSGITAGNYLTTLGQYYNIVPKVLVGASATTGGIGSMGATTLATATSGLVLTQANRQPLYDSVDELMFTPSRAQNLNSSNTALTLPQLEETKFFLTAHSRSPDVNLFNEPRVGIWPISGNTPVSSYQTALDQLIAFCTTINKNIFYFQRKDYSSPTTDISIARNQSLLAYLKSFGKQSVPGFGPSTTNTFANKYNTANPNPVAGSSGTDLDQIFTEIFDYIRCTNLSDTGLPIHNQYTAYLSGTAAANNLTTANEVAPSTDVGAGTGNTGTKGFGRMLTVSQAALVFIATADGTWNANNPTFFESGTPPATPALGKVSISAALLLNIFDPALGFPTLTPDPSNYVITISGLSGFGLNFPSSVVQTVSTYPYGTTLYRQYGGTWGPSPLYNEILNVRAPNNQGPPVSTTPFTVSNTGPFAFGGGTATVTIQYKGVLIQTLNFHFPAANFPVPAMVNGDLTTGPDANYPTTTQSLVAQAPWAHPYVPASAGPPAKPAVQAVMPWVVPMQTNTPGSPAALTLDFTSFAQRFNYSNYAATGNFTIASHSTITPYDVVEAVQSTSGDLRLSAAKYDVSSSDPVFSPHPRYGNTSYSMAHSMVHGEGGPMYGATRGSLAHFTPPAGTSGYFSTAQSWSPFGSPWTVFVSPPGSTPFPAFSPNSAVAVESPGKTLLTPSGNPGGGAPSAQVNGQSAPNTAGRYETWVDTAEPEVRATDGVVAGYAPPSVTSSSVPPPDDFSDWSHAGSNPVPGDWDNGMANVKDGAYINKPDEGSITHSAGSPAYFDFGGAGNPVGSTLFSPNRQIPSAVMFGSLPTGVFANRPWQTLLFRPNPLGAGAGNQHLGAQSPPDHLLLDLFTMPVVEPYAISEPLSTAGRINMNYQILPFTYINRDTGIRAVIKSERILAIPNGDAGGGSMSSVAAATSYKNSDWGNSLGSTASAPVLPAYLPNDLRFDINPTETLKGFQYRFANNDIFRSPSEICTLDLVPYDTTDATDPPTWSVSGSTMASYWADHALTGDNSRERPYADIYPRLTTKSNTFTIHMRVQTLQQTKTDINSQPTVWSEGTDQITGEYRGSEIVERYVDPNDTSIPDYAATTYTTSGTVPPAISQYYKFRVVSTKQFAP